MDRRGRRPGGTPPRRVRSVRPGIGPDEGEADEQPTPDSRQSSQCSRVESSRGGRGPPKPTVSESGRSIRQSVPARRIRPDSEAMARHVAELKKVTWPDKETTKNLTLVVIGISALLGVLLGGIDWVLLQLFRTDLMQTGRARSGEETDMSRVSLRERLSRSVRKRPAEKVATPEGQWYVLHTYSGYENKVKKSIESRVESLDLGERVYEIVVPTQEEIEIKTVSAIRCSAKVFPGYVLVRMEMDDETWYALRNTPGVTGFVNINNKPVPLRRTRSPGIMKGMTAEAPKVKITFQLGDTVRIIDGPFADFRGEIDEINQEKGKIRVLVSFFGRETPVELDFLQAERETYGVRGDATPPRRRCRKFLANVYVHMSNFRFPRQGHTGAAGRSRARPARRCDHELLQGVQRAHRRMAGQIIPVLITVYEDRSFTFVTKTPPASDLLRRAAGIDKGSGQAESSSKVGKVTQIRSARSPKSR